MTTNGHNLEASDRASMLSAISSKIATKEQSGEYVWHNPVMIGDVLDWVDEETPKRKQGHQRSILIVWKNKGEPLSAQDTECIAYVFSLI